MVPKSVVSLPSALTFLMSVALVAACEQKTSGGGGAGGSTNVDRTGGSGGNRTGGAGGSGGASSAGGSTGSGTGGAGVMAGGAGGSGTPGTGGSGLGGSTGGDAGPAMSFDPPADKAVGKFCNGLEGENMMVLEFALEIGTTRLVAKTGECFPAPPQACAPLPVGPVTVKVFDMADGMMLAEAMGTVPGGAQMLFVADIDQMSGMPSLSGGRIRSDADCSKIAFGTMPSPPDAGASDRPPPVPPRM